MGRGVGGAGCLGAARRPVLRNARGNAGYPGPRSPDPRGKYIRTRHPPWGRRANGSADALMGVPGGGPGSRSPGFGAIPKERGWICARDPPWGRRVKIPPARPMGGGFRECPRSGVHIVDFQRVFPMKLAGPWAPKWVVFPPPPPPGSRMRSRPASSESPNRGADGVGRGQRWTVESGSVATRVDVFVCTVHPAAPEMDRQVSASRPFIVWPS